MFLTFISILSLHHFNLDNHTFIKLHPFFFLIKDHATRKVLLRGPCRGGLYHLPQLSSLEHKFILPAIKSSSTRWHCRLGHPSQEIVLCILRDNNIPWSSIDSKESVCDACLHAKARQLPYTHSSTCSSAPLNLIFSDVWEATLDYFGRKQYYVSFIDYYSKFT
jgi:hypothetical protein